MKDLKMAWRNLWRNRKRTMITLASIFFGVLLSTLMTSMQEGIYSNMIDNVVKSYTGYIQIHNPDFWENKTINNTLEHDPKLAEEISKIREVSEVIPRLESFSLMSFKDKTKGGLLIGIDPEKEEKLSEISRWVETGKYLKQNDDGILIAANLAKHMKIAVGDTLVLLSQGYHGASAAGLFPIKGVLRFPSPTMNNIGIYMSIAKAQEFFAAPNKLTSYAILLEDYNKVAKAQRKISAITGDKYSVMNWKELVPELVQMIQSDRSGGTLMKATLYMIVAFGILGTIIMMVAERRRELGVMIAVGMQRIRLSKILLFESVFIGFLGVAAGFFISIPIVLFLIQAPIPITGETAQIYIQYGMEPAIVFSGAPSIFIQQAFIILIFSLLIGLYPYLTVRKLTVIKALRS